MQSDELFAPKLLIRHVEHSTPHQLGPGGRSVFRVGRLTFDRVFVQVRPIRPPSPVTKRMLGT